MTVIHVVQFAFKDGVAEEKKKEITSDFLALQTNCLQPPASKDSEGSTAEGKPYIISVTGGPDISIENLHNDFTHVFIVTFASRADRDYYVNSDPAHTAFVEEYAKPFWSKAQVLDFEA